MRRIADGDWRGNPPRGPRPGGDLLHRVAYAAAHAALRMAPPRPSQPKQYGCTPAPDSGVRL